MKSITILILACFAALLIGCNSNVHEYYVSNSGDDAASGTSPGKAWKSIEKVNETTFKPGDKILFEGGESFTGALKFDIEDSGTPDNPVTVTSFGEGRATISSGSETGLLAVNTSGMVVEELNFIGAGVIDGENFSGIHFYTDLDTVKPEFIRINNVEVSGYRWDGISIQGERKKGSSGYRDVRITHAVVRDGGDKGIAIGGTMPEGDWGHKDIYIGNCKVYNIRGISGKSGHSGNGIIVSQLDGGVIEYCVVYNNGEFSDDMNSGGPIGIWAWDSRNVVFQFNEAYENKTGNRADGGGFDLDGGCVNCIMQYNYSHDNHGGGYGIYQYRGAREFKGNIFRYNISENDGITNKHGGINLWSTNSSGGMQDTKIYNNTIYVSENTVGAAIEDFPDVQGECYIYNTQVYNNIFVGPPGKELVKILNPSEEWIFKNNCYYSYGDKIEIIWGDEIYSSLDEWRAATGQERHNDSDVGFEIDPELADPGNGGTIGDAHQLGTLGAYMLKQSSPLIDRGLDIKTEFGFDVGPRDYFGTPVPVNEKFDVGAAENK
ncbi:MAG: right-handed parallel beta-helix repeat-containing protein [Bacteroidales bacterium]|nr:right-handed parallel beta-helix repeat-containing protein [Bacteroidales bacterium]